MMLATLLLVGSTVGAVRADAINATVASSTGTSASSPSTAPPSTDAVAIKEGNLTLSSFQHCNPGMVDVMRNSIHDAIAMAATASSRHRYDIGWEDMTTDPGFLEYFGAVEGSKPRLHAILENVEQLANMATTGGEIDMNCERQILKYEKLEDLTPEQRDEVERSALDECPSMRDRGVEPLAFVKHPKIPKAYPQAPNVTFCNAFFNRLHDISHLDSGFDRAKIDANWLRRSQGGLVLHELTHVKNSPLQFFDPKAVDQRVQGEGRQEWLQKAYGAGLSKLLALKKDVGPKLAAQNADSYALFILTSWARKHFNIPYPSFPRAWNPLKTSKENFSYEQKQSKTSPGKTLRGFNSPKELTLISPPCIQGYYRKEDFNNSVETVRAIERDGLFQPMELELEGEDKLRPWKCEPGHECVKRSNETSTPRPVLGEDDCVRYAKSDLEKRDAVGEDFLVPLADFEDEDAWYSVQYL